MTIVGLHASHEQIPPSQLLHAVQRAEDAGFDAAMCSDHFAPWSERQGQSGFAWAWLGAAMARTSLPFGVVNAPGQRYHPAIIAQAMATLAEMFPGRFWAALGSGEAANEHITGEAWPDKARRNQRLAECVDVIRRLFDGEEVTHRGEVVVDQARLWTRPVQPPPIIGAAVSTATAGWVGSWADGLITVGNDPASLRDVVAAFREGGGEQKPCYLQVHLSWATTRDEALQIAHEQWRTNVFNAPLMWDTARVDSFDEAARYVTPADVAEKVIVSADPAEHLDRLSELVEVGFDGVWLHHVGVEQVPFIETFGEHVVPELRQVGA